MKKLRLTAEEKNMLLQDVEHTLKEICKNNISVFEYTKKDVQDFLNNLTDNTVEKPTLMIVAEVYTKMYELVKQSDIELQWHMLVERDIKTNNYLIYDIMLFPQINSGVSTTTDEKAFAEWQMNLIKDPEFPIEDLRGHGHSHVNMNVYSSGIDDAYQRDLITKVEDGDYYIFLVLNKRMEMFALIYDFRQQILFETKDIDIKIMYCGTDIRKWCTDQIKLYCKSAPKYTRPCYDPTPWTGDLRLHKMTDDDYIADITTKGNFTGRRR